MFMLTQKLRAPGVAHPGQRNRDIFREILNIRFIQLASTRRRWERDVCTARIQVHISSFEGRWVGNDTGEGIRARESEVARRVL